MKELRNILSGMMILLFFAAGCKKEPQVDKILRAEDLPNISYGTHSRNTMDLYLPESRDSNTPVIILVHGGSWFEGDKSSFTDLAKYWRDRGYVAATINYRLTHTSENNIHPAQVNDIGKAIEFISSEADAWQISADKFALLGVSAGAHLSLLYTYKFNKNKKIRAIVSMAGPTDLTNPQGVNQQQAQVLAWLIGASFQSEPGKYAEASPLNSVSSASMPTLIFHGKLDLLVPYQQSVELQSRLEKNGVPSKLILFDDTGHEVLNLTNTATFLAATDSWLKLYLK